MNQVILDRGVPDLSAARIQHVGQGVGAKRAEANASGAEYGAAEQKGIGGDNARKRQPASASFSFFMAFFSIWRIRSAETPYSSARSCSVVLSSSSQRR